MGAPELLMIVIVFGLLVYPTIAGAVRSAQAKEWGWFGAIIGAWLVGLGWLAGWIYLLGPGKKPRPVEPGQS